MSGANCPSQQTTVSLANGHLPGRRPSIARSGVSGFLQQSERPLASGFLQQTTVSKANRPSQQQTTVSEWPQATSKLPMALRSKLPQVERMAGPWQQTTVSDSLPTFSFQKV